ncbi:hypothetical protein BDY21DRAFT_333992 [Lineolata rhizophorae]|uniref:Uncharacterized protein n=1 Tax=Lineolata rhizophorae TaxID=578093 RepID=A0A6A6PAR1_9PEZI|nr:hypothetical protein BDY21DRAFT_333992 [Lineolata rhizophorae]
MDAQTPAQSSTPAPLPDCPRAAVSQTSATLPSRGSGCVPPNLPASPTARLPIVPSFEH